uniref:Uncharacterized protein n=1 Tax=Podarcis muralis TaxID=64176 RepID=A0A670IWR4_PODMU
TTPPHPQMLLYPLIRKPSIRGFEACSVPKPHISPGRDAVAWACASSELPERSARHLPLSCRAAEWEEAGRLLRGPLRWLALPLGTGHACRPSCPIGLLRRCIFPLYELELNKASQLACLP